MDTEKSAEIARIPVGDSPEAIYLSPDGKWLSVAIEENDQVVIVDTAKLAVARKFRMKGKNPEHAVWSPDGKWLYVSAEEADSVDIVDLAKGEVVKSVKVGDRPRGIGFLPDGSRAYVAAENADMLNVIDTAKQATDREDQGVEPLQRRGRPSRRQARLRVARAARARCR